jgi:cytochrome P450
MIATILGVPHQDRDMFKDASTAIVQFMNQSNPNRDLTPEFARSADRFLADLLAYLRQLLDARRRDPRDDMTSLLVRAKFADDSLEDEETLFNLVMFLVAGHETTTSLLASAVYLLLEHPEQLALVRQAGHHLTAAIDETLRFEAPVQRLRRVASEDVKFGDALISAGEPVELVVGSANRDERVFERPAVFDIARQRGSALPFGKGTHFCIGKGLALLEAEVALSTLFERYPKLALAAGWTPSWAEVTNLRCLSSLLVTGE